jgi:G3E family GTPase
MGSAPIPVTILAGPDAMPAGEPRVRSVQASATAGASIFAAERLSARAGCLCCSVADDLVRALRELHAQRLEGRIEPFERVVVQASGEADLRPILAALGELPLVAARYAPAAIVVVVASAAQAAHDATRAQVAMADRVIARTPDAARAAAPVNPGAAIDLLPAGFPARWLETGTYRGSPPRLAPAEANDTHAYRPIGQGAPQAIATCAWHATEPFAPGRLEPALEEVVRVAGERLLRMKGVVRVAAEGAPRAVHAVGHTLYPSARLPEASTPGPASRIVFAGRGLEEGRIASILDSFLQR